MSNGLLYRQAMPIYLAITADNVVTCLFGTFMSWHVQYGVICEALLFVRSDIFELRFTSARLRVKATVVRLRQ
jgi:hypothetical protein